MFIILLAVYFGMALLVFLFQRKFLYHPTNAAIEELVPAAAGFGYVPWTNSAGQFIGWKQIAKGPGAQKQLLIVHGNGGCAINRVRYANGLQAVEMWDVYLLEYPGYGAREGSPSQQAFFDAASEALELLKKKGNVYVMGESLGTGVACHLAGANPESVAGVLLIAPYNRLTGVAQQHMPIFPVGLLLWDRYPAEDYLKNYHGPVAMLFAGSDVVVPNKFGHALYDGYNGPKIFTEVPGAGHNDLMDEPDEYWRSLVKFWNEHHTVAPGGR